MYKGLRYISHHVSATLIASYSSSGCYNNEDAHLNRAIDMFNKQVTFFEKMSSSSIASSPFSQKPLSSNVDGFQFQQLIKKSSLADIFCFSKK